MCQPNTNYPINHCDPKNYCESKCSSPPLKKEEAVVFIQNKKLPLK